MGAPGIRVVIGVIGLAWGLASEALYYRSGAPAPDVLRDLAVGWTYLFGGLAIWSSRPANPTGRLMTLVGFTWFIGNLQLSDIGLLDAIGTAFADVIFVCLIALILAYPTGHLETRLDRVTVVILAVGTTVNNAVRLVPLPAEVSLDLPRLYVGVALASFAGIVVIRRWVVAPARRAAELLPVLIGGTVLMGVLITSLVIQFFEVPEDLQAFLLAARGLAPAAIPLALLVGFYRQSELRQRALLDAIPDLMIRFTRDGHYLDIREEDSTLIARSVDPMVSGRIEDLLPAGVAASLTDGRRGGARHWRRPDPGPRARPADRAARVRDADHPERGRRGDGDRPRLQRAASRPGGASPIARQDRRGHRRRAAAPRTGPSRRRPAAPDLDLPGAPGGALEARSGRRPRGGRGPADRRRRAPGRARRAAGARPRDPSGDPDRSWARRGDRFARRAIDGPRRGDGPSGSAAPAAVEATAYFVVSEALANVAKYASASRATVSADCRGDLLRVEVADDGVGGADARGGSGLRGLGDRVAAIGGSLVVESPIEGGTQVIAEIPLAA